MTLLVTQTEEEIKQFHLKRPYELSKDLEFVVPQLDEPTYEQIQWINFRLSHPSTWPKVHENKIGDWEHWK